MASKTKGPTQAQKLAALQTAGVDTDSKGLTAKSSHKDLDAALAESNVEATAGKSAGKGTKITVTVREGRKTSSREFSSESNGKDWRKVAAEFIETAQTVDEHSASRAKYVSHVEE